MTDTSWQPWTALLTLGACAAWWCGYAVFGYRLESGRDTPWWYHVALVQLPMAVALSRGFAV